MNQLIASDIRMTSLDIAELTGKMHKHVMADIRKEITELGEEIGQPIFRPSSYTNKQNKKQPCFEFGKEGAMQLALKYDAKTRYKVIKRIEELENKQQEFKLPSNYKEALIQLVEQVEENEKLETHKKMLEQQISEYEPKVNYVDEILKSKDLLLTTQIAEDYGMTAQAFNKVLHKHGIQYKMNGQWLLYGKYKGLGYTKSETTPYKRKDGTEGVSLLTKWTQKGRLFLYEFLKSKDILPTMEQMKLTLIENKQEVI